MFGCPRPRYSTPLRAKSGCMTCRRRKKKCGEEFPICELCSRLYLKCSWPRAKPTRSTSSHNAAPGVQPKISETGQSLMIEWGKASFETKLLQYFQEEFFPQLTRPHLRPGFSRAYSFSLAEQKRPLMDAILACSAIHLSVNYSQFKAVSISYYATSVSALRKQLNPEICEGIEDWFIWQATYLCLFERWNTDEVSHPVPHSSAALEFFNMQLANSKGLESEYYMINNILYNAAILPFFKNQRSPNNLLHRLPPLYHSTPMQGAPHWASPILFDWISTVSYLSHRAPLCDADVAQAVELQKCLQKYSISMASIVIVKSDSSAQQTYAAISSALFVISAQILLYKLLSPRMSAEHHLIHEQITDAIAIMQTTSEEVRFDQCFCWPILIMGFAITKNEQVEFLRGKLNEMWQNSFCGDVKRVAEVLEKVWTITSRAGKLLGRFRLVRFDMLLQRDGLFDVFLGKVLP